MKNTINYIELNKTEYENTYVKNKYIRDCENKYIAYLCSDVTNSMEIEEVLETYNLLDSYDVVVFGANVPYGEAGLVETLDAFEMDIYAFVFNRDIMIKAGCFNEKLTAMTNYEFICRLASETKIFFVNCQSEVENKNVGNDIEAYIETVGYVCRRYLSTLDESESVEVLQRLMCKMELLGLKSQFMKELNSFLTDNSIYYEIAGNTSPILVISGDDTCYGVLKAFASNIAKELVCYGQAVKTTDGRYGDYDSKNFGEKQFKGIVGVQSLALEKDFIRELPWKKIQFWFDNPMFFEGLFENLGNDYYVMCQDEYYAKDLKTYYNVKNAIQLPPAGELSLQTDKKEKIYDIVFIGSYNKTWNGPIEDKFSKEFYEYMISNPKYTYTEGLKKLLELKKINLADNEFKNLLFSLKEICRRVTFYYKKAVIDALLEAGFEVHVYGDTWKDYENSDKPNLIMHPAVTAKEAMDEYGKAKIALNIMSWHKAGMTERIANIMLSGAVCLSDETTYLKENFVDGEEIILFELDRLDELKTKVDKMLNDENYRQQISSDAYAKASKEHTWKNRAEKIIELLNGMQFDE